MRLATLKGFYNGQVDLSFSRAFATSLDKPLALYNLGGYAEDDWRVNNNLNLTLVARFEHNSNPICVRSCFGRLSAPFEDLNHDVNIPYNAAINPNAQQAFFQSTAVSLTFRESGLPGRHSVAGTRWSAAGLACLHRVFPVSLRTPSP